MTTQEKMDLVSLVKQIRHSYALEQYTDAALQPLLKALDQAQSEILASISNKAAELSTWQEERALALLDEWSDMQLGLRNYLGESIAEIGAHAGASSYLVHNDILSFSGAVNGFNNVALTASQVQQMLVSTPVGGQLLSGWIDSAFEAQKEGIRQEILTGLLKGEGYPAMVRRLREGYDMSREDAISIARSYVQAANVNAAHDVARANSEIMKGWKWESATENGAYYTKSGKGRGRGICMICLALASSDEIYPMDGGPEIPAHVRCLVGETPVFAPDLIGGYRSFYDGPVIRIVLSTGREITASINHMFLTPHGFAHAAGLRKGDDVFYYPLFDGLVDSPDDNRNPPIIEQVVTALSESSGSTTTTQSITGDEFHGDGAFMHGDVNIIRADSLLGSDGETPALEQFNQGNLSGALAACIKFPGDRQLLSVFQTMRSAVGSPDSRQPSSFFLRRPNVFPELASLSFGSENNPQGFETAHNGKPVDTEHFPQLIGGVPGQIQTCKVIHVELLNYKGYVYDLETTCSLYVSNGLVSSNCRCVRKYVTKSWRELGIPVDEIESAARPYTVRGKGIDAETGEIITQSVGAGGRNILSVGLISGNFEDFFAKILTPIERKMTIGPRRLELWQSGKVKLGDLVTIENGKARLLTLKELPS